nr:MAG TPA_asm: hypothetical protein [Caudoviricetes sp.]
MTAGSLPAAFFVSVQINARLFIFIFRIFPIQPFLCVRGIFILC